MSSNNGYIIEPTAAGSSSQKGIAERPNRTIAETLRAILMGAGLNATYWSDVLVHLVWVKNRLPHA